MWASIFTSEDSNIQNARNLGRLKNRDFSEMAGFMGPDEGFYGGDWKFSCI